MFSAETKKEMLGWVERGKRAVATAANYREKAEATMGIAISTFEIQFACFGFGYARGYCAIRGKSYELAGVAPDLLAGLLLHGAGFLGAFGKHSEHAHALANGALASYTNFQGVKLGSEAATRAARAAAGQPALPATSGAMNDQQLADLIRAQRAA